LGLIMACNHANRFSESADAARALLNDSPDEFATHADQLLAVYIETAVGWLQKGQIRPAYDLLQRVLPLAEHRQDQRIFNLFEHARKALEQSAAAAS
jgi:hypothetical protein